MEFEFQFLWIIITNFPQNRLWWSLKIWNKVGIRHSRIYRNMHKYIEKVDPILHKLALTDIICFIKILNSLTKNKFISIYNKAFSLIYQKVIFADSYKANAVNEDDRMTYPKFKFLLNSLTGCIKIAENNHNIRAVVYDQLVREFILINSRVNTRIKYPILWKFSENFLQILSKSRIFKSICF